jgi:hypothetical protein
LVEDRKAKYGIYDEDTYNFDESVFIIGMILTRAVVKVLGVEDGQRAFSRVTRSGL